MHRRQLLKAAGAAVAFSALPSLGRTKALPHPISLIVPYAVGGNGDVTARLFADALTRVLDQSVIVENKAGGGGAIGANYVIGSKPDGTTLIFSAPGVFSVTPHLVKVDYTIASIQPVCLVSKVPLVLVARKGKYKNLEDLIRAAGARSQEVSLGYGGLGTPNHLAMLDLEQVAGVKFNGVPYRGSAPMLQDLLAGQIDVGTDQITTSQPLIESGALAPIAVFGAPLEAFPDVPSISTLGKEPFDVTTYLGVAAPVGAPRAIMAELQKACRMATEDAKFISGMGKIGSTVYWGSGQDYERSMQAENDFVKKMTAAGRIKGE